MSDRLPRAAVQEGLVDDILADPADDSARLIYADWLADHGDPDRAELIRTMIQEPAWFDKPVAELKWWADRHRQRYEHARDWMESAGDDELSAQTLPGWKGDSPAAFFWNRIHPAYKVKARWMRGFIHLVRCPLASWINVKIGPGLARHHPLERVILRDVAPTEWADAGTGRRVWVWYPGGAFPRELYEALPARKTSETRVTNGTLPVTVYPSEQLARNDMSAAAIIWARSMK